MKTLYIFATSERPDVYVNTLSYCVDHLGIDAIQVVAISEHDYPEETQTSRILATTVVGNISRQLQELLRGKYAAFREGQEQPDITELRSPSGVGVYQRSLDAMNASGTTGIVVPLSELDRELRSYVAKGSCLFDVSALKKNLLVDVVATLLSIGFSEVYSFELRVKQTYGQADLYHNLAHGDDFVYRNLARSASVRESLNRIGRWSTRAQAVLLFTLVLALVFIPLSVWLKGSWLLTCLNVGSMIASVGSYLFLLVRDRG